MTKERFVEFLEANIFNKYKNKDENIKVEKPKKEKIKKVVQKKANKSVRVDALTKP